MKVYVVTYDYKPTDSLWGDEYYDKTILLKTYQDENKAEEFCNYCNKLIEDFYNNYESEDVLEIMYNCEYIMSIYKDHEENGCVSYMEFELE